MTQESYAQLATIEKGRIHIDRGPWDQVCKRFPDGPVEVSIKVARPSRSSQQNRYWHGVVIPLFAEHCGYEFDEMKDALALKLLPREVTDLETGEVRIVPGHTSQLNVKEFNELIERAQRLGAEMGIYIPDPGEVAA